MATSAALDKVIEYCRRLIGEERLALSFALQDLSCDIAREGIRRLIEKQ